MIKLGKETGFYNLLEAQAQVAVKAARLFHQMSQDLPNMGRYIEQLRDVEHEGDDLTHELQNKVASTFITPLDKEDLRDLSQALDDVTDVIEAAAVRAELYKLNEARPDLEPLVGCLLQATELTATAVGELRNGFHRSRILKDKLTEIHTIENESDYQFRKALAGLFDDPAPDALNVIKWKEMYDRIEAAVDKCEDIAKIIGTVIVKYA
jgi:predicted phosphate transport protein (TIGR00153 family)